MKFSLHARLLASAAAGLLMAQSAVAATYCGTPTAANLWAGQSTLAGSVTIGNDSSNLYVTYTSTGGWEMQRTQLHVGDTLTPIPVNKQGMPKIGNFQYQTAHAPRVTTFTYTIAKTNLSLDYNQSIVLAAHAELVKVDSAGAVVGAETGWAAGTPVMRFVDRGSWATYVPYIWQDCTPDKPIETDTETAFAYHGSYPGACFLDLDLDGDGRDDFNRWGWTVGALSEGSYTFDIYAAAGQCRLSAGTKVGKLIVEYSAGTAIVSLVMEGTNPSTGVAYNLVEAQLYVGAEPLPRDVNNEFTVAPGQYPDNAGELKSVRSKTFEVSGLSGKIYIVAHASVAGFPL